MRKYFVEAAIEIIEEEGTKAVTIRKVADQAGYNGATICNYFSEFSRLLFFASMRLMKEYTEEVTRRMNEKETAVEQDSIAPRHIESLNEVTILIWQAEFPCRRFSFICI